MEVLKKMIVERGRVINEDILKVDEFLNHQIDIDLMNEIGKEFFRYYGDRNITKILTIESSGIAIAAIVAQYFKVPIVFAKKTKSLNLQGEMYTSTVRSYTKCETFDLVVAQKFLSPEDNILVIDDFLAEGSACLGLLDIIKNSGANLVGIGIVIEKGYQKGGALLREMGLDLYSLAIVDSMSQKDGIVFRDQN